MNIFNKILFWFRTIECIKCNVRFPSGEMIDHGKSGFMCGHCWAKMIDTRPRPPPPAPIPTKEIRLRIVK